MLHAIVTMFEFSIVEFDLFIKCSKITVSIMTDCDLAANQYCMKTQMVPAWQPVPLLSQERDNDTKLIKHH